LINRRTFVSRLVLGPLVLPGFACGQKTVHRIGVLIPGAMTADLVGSEPRNPTVNGFLRAMRARGYIYGDDFVIEARGGEGRRANLSRLARELVDLKMDVIVAAGPTLWALKEASTSVPVVMAAAPDAVQDGFAQSLARPGGNSTGMSMQLAETTGKRLQYLKDLVPGNAPVGVMWEAPGDLPSWYLVESAARARGWRLQSLEVRETEGVERAFQTAHNARAGALLVNGSGLFDRHAALITGLAIQYRLPAMYALPRFVDNFGGLMSYSPNLVAIWERAAYYVDKILRGAKPGDLPIEQHQFELLINLTAAKQIGLAVPQSFRQLAHRVIEPPLSDDNSKVRP